MGPLRAAAAALPQIDVIPIPASGPIPEGATGSVLVTRSSGTPNLAEALSRGVEWVHAVGTGVDGFPLDQLDGRPFTCNRGANAVFIAEWVMAQLLAVVKRLPDAWVHEPPEQWGTPELSTLQGATVALFGVGAIGTAVARRALAFESKVRGYRRTDAPAPLVGIEMVTSIEELVAGADHVVVAAPLTDATRGVVDARFLDAMQPGAHLVNISRGGLVDEDALRDALDGGRVGVASLDVASQEPLPADHWFYSHPRVHFSAHCSYSGPGVWELLEMAFVDAFRAWERGDPLPNLVDVERGY
jgi:phosphoglycerate dehydrogenase-like enzyme